MRKFTFILIGMLVVSGLIAQTTRVKFNGNNVAVKMEKATTEGISPVNVVSPYVNPITDAIESDMGTTIYDLPSNSCTPYGRLYVYPDGTKAGVWTLGKNPTAYPDRGTGYNYYDGSAWGPDPTLRIESVRTGWPSYAPCGPNGEIVVSHQSGTLPLVVSKRENKGTGSWTQTFLNAPSEASGMLWPRMITTGEDHNTVHVIALTAPVANGGSLYQNLDGALLYCKSEDGGVTFGDWQLLDGLTSEYYLGFGGDSYSWLIPYENDIAFVISESSVDLILMHSADNGDTWEKIVVWEHPYPFYSTTMVTEKFYCPDGSAHGVIDKYGKIHLAFGVNRAYADGASSYWFPWVDGVAYWNSDKPTWLGGDTLALHPDSLYAHGDLIGWMQDVDGNGTLDLIYNSSGSYALYYIGPTSMPQIIYDNDNDILYAVFASVTEGYETETQDRRHLWTRVSYDRGATWSDFTDLVANIFHIFDECVFPVISPTFDGGCPALLYQRDEEPGLSVRGDEDPPTTNYITYMMIDEYVGIKEGVSQSFKVEQNFPNP
ncbi:MAG TPA: hypothetical protein DCX03_02715, partial [Bacteroidales bacterium]|nr:hypothetical protein [Bacteroidales bacterium]